LSFTTLKSYSKPKLVLVALIGALTLLSVQAQQVPIPTTPAQVPGPAAGTAMTKEYVQMVGRMAYMWGYAMVNSHNRRAAFAYVTSKNGNVPGWNGPCFLWPRWANLRC
jgi:hypothetical protein